jgi:hypothetical protein
MRTRTRSVSVFLAGLLRRTDTIDTNFGFNRSA